MVKRDSRGIPIPKMPDFTKMSYVNSEFFQREIKKYPRRTPSERRNAVTDVIRKMKAAGIKRNYTLPKKF